MAKRRRHPAQEKRVADAIYASEQRALREVFSGPHDCSKCCGYGYLDEQGAPTIPTIGRNSHQCPNCWGKGR